MRFYVRDYRVFSAAAREGSRKVNNSSEFSVVIVFLPIVSGDETMRCDGGIGGRTVSCTQLYIFNQFNQCGVPSLGFDQTGYQGVCKR